MGTVTMAGELTGRDELEQLWRLDASESAPEEDDGEDDDTDTDTETETDDEDEDGGEPFKPRDIPHG